MEGKFYVMNEGRVVGPVTEDLIVKGVIAGKVPKTSQISKAGSDSWHPLTKLPLVAEALKLMGVQG